ncbi:MAG: class I SAM-dependent methyltransferase [Rectinemataceae bacterium]|nr:class I SAM-dependent methyltransferase [Rectinemataceae bacterium]
MSLLDNIAAAFVRRILRVMISDAETSDIINKALLRLVNEDEAFKRALWRSANIRPHFDCWHEYRPTYTVSDRRADLATTATAYFIERHAPKVRAFANHLDHLDFALSEITVPDGLVCEFGVYHGTTINRIAARYPNKEIHGFDSFEGLPEDWMVEGSKGTYSTGKVIPQTAPNVKMHIGLFHDTLPLFLEKHEGPAAFLHIDSDIYSSAKTVLTLMRRRIVSGTVIVFDEFFNYAGFQEHEFRAFFEFIKETSHAYEIRGYVDRGFAVAICIL